MPENFIDLTKCNQEKCDKPSAYLFTWPGKDQQAICEEHAPQLMGVAAAIGLHLQLIPILYP
jgi:hypothetical protein